MKLTRFARATAVLAAAALAFSACAGHGGPDEPAPNGNDNRESEVGPGFFPQADDGGEPVNGGTLTMADYSEGRSLDPSKVIPTGASGATPLVAVYDQLMRLNPETLRFEPKLAEAVEHNDDYTEWTIKLRPDAKFSDGTPVDADAVAGSMNWYTGTRAYDMALVGPLWGGVEVVDDLTVKVTLKETWTTFDSQLGRSLGFIVAPAAIAGGPENFKPIGAGPFTFENYAPGEELVLKANPNYWDGAPHLEKLRFVWLGADQTKHESLQSGQVQATLLIGDDLIIKNEAEKGTPRFTTLANNGWLVLMNHAEGQPGSYPQVRKAIAHALDPQFLNERAYDGARHTGRTLFAPMSKWYDDSVEVNEYDVEAAKKLLEEAKAEGFDGTLPLLGNASNEEVVMLIKGQLEAAGFTVEVELVRNVADYITRLYAEKNYSVTPTGLTVLDAYPYSQMYVSLHSGAPSNITNLEDPKLDALIDELRTTPIDDEDATRDVVHRLETYYQESIPAITYGYATPTTFWSDNVYGITGTNEMMTDYSKAWIKP